MKYILLIGALLLIKCTDKKSLDSVPLGTSMPNFKLTLLDSTQLNSQNIPMGKSTLLFYFGTNCPYSHAQMKSVINNIDLLKNVQLYIFTANTLDEMKIFAKKYELSKYPTITPGLDFNYLFNDFFKTQTVPYIAAFDKQKKLLKTFVGNTDISKIKNAFDK